MLIRCCCKYQKRLYSPRIFGAGENLPKNQQDLKQLLKETKKKESIQEPGEDRLGPEFTSPDKHLWPAKVKEEKKKVEKKTPLWKKFMVQKPTDLTQEDIEFGNILLFPGQGSQFVGMGKQLIDIPKLRRLFERASIILGYDLLKLCLEGPVKNLNKTIHCQPALFVTSVAAAEKLKIERPGIEDNTLAVAGYSVGEYAAFVYAGIMEFEEALKLVQLRAELMQLASERTASAMVSVAVRADSRLGEAMKAAKEWMVHKKSPVQHPECVIANHLLPGLKVVGGHEEAIQFLMDCGQKEFALGPMKRLPVSGAFHTPLMRLAQDCFWEQGMVNAKMEFQPKNPKLRVYSNVSGDPYPFGKVPDMKIREMISTQIMKPVKWETIIANIYTTYRTDKDNNALYPATFEVGPGKQLVTVLKRIAYKKAGNRATNVEV